MKQNRNPKAFEFIYETLNQDKLRNFLEFSKSKEP